MQSRTGLLAVTAAVLLLVGATLLQGLWTDRWVERRSGVLEESARLLEQAFPRSFGEWRMDRELETNPAELERAGAVGSISRVYRNQKTKTPVSTFVVCATPHDASGHTPDRCYPGAGFEIAEPEHRQSIDLRDGRVAEAFTGTFAKQGQTLRVFWTYGVAAPTPKGPADGGDAPAAAGPALQWLAPSVARIALNEYAAVYKLYVIVDQTKLPVSRATGECSDFIAELLPAFEAALATGSPAATPPAGGPATDGQRPAAEAPAETSGASAG